MMIKMHPMSRQNRLGPESKHGSFGRKRKARRWSLDRKNETRLQCFADGGKTYLGLMKVLLKKPSPKGQGIRPLVFEFRRSVALLD